MGHSWKSYEDISEIGLNLQAWRIPLWVRLAKDRRRRLTVSTSKPGESLCGHGAEQANIIYATSVSTSKPGESLCGLYQLY